MTGTRFIALAAAALAAGLTVTACGSGPQSAQATATSHGDAGRAEIQAIVTCYRAHGAPDFPDPVYDPADGRWHFGTSPGSAPLTTQQACQHLLPQAQGSPPVPQAQFQQLVRLANCIRQHGAPTWPDPNPRGEFPLPPPLLTKTPASERALTACARYVPSGGLNAVAAP